MPYVPARTLSSWALANLREDSQIQHLFLYGHLEEGGSKLCCVSGDPCQTVVDWSAYQGHLLGQHLGIVEKQAWSMGSNHTT